MLNQADQFYIDKVIAGETSAFAVLVDRHKFNVFNITVKILGNKEEAEELAQDVFLKAFEKLSTFKGEAKFSTWLFRIAYNMSISMQRKRKLKQLDIESYYSETYTEDELMNKINSESIEVREKALKTAIRKLNGEQQLLLQLYYDKGLTISEVAKIIGLTDSNVKVKIHRTRQQLFRLMQPRVLQKIS